jgi:hypothetical protein
LILVDAAGLLDNSRRAISRLVFEATKCSAVWEFLIHRSSLRCGKNILVH